MSAGTPHQCQHPRGRGFHRKICWPPIAQTPAMAVETDRGTEQRPIDTVHGQLVVPALRPGEEAFHSIDGRCHVINTGNH